jgi:pimeloyl-ACP methyl ester carboxylesterase
MLLATHDRRIKSVAVTTPSSVPWFGRTVEQSAWTFKGAPVPALRLGLTSDAPQVSRFEAALADSAAVSRTRFSLEKINGPILLLSAEQDNIWPSYAMSNSMVAYLEERRFPHAVTHISYPTGHGFSKDVVPGLKATVVEHFLKSFQ